VWCSDRWKIEKNEEGELSSPNQSLIVPLEFCGVPHAPNRHTVRSRVAAQRWGVNVTSSFDLSASSPSRPPTRPFREGFSSNGQKIDAFARQHVMSNAKRCMLNECILHKIPLKSQVADDDDDKTYKISCQQGGIEITTQIIT
jgi:hypothetical protein